MGAVLLDGQPARDRLPALLRDREEAAVEAVWSVPPQRCPTALRCALAPLSIAEGRPAILVEATPPAAEPDPAETVRRLEAALAERDAALGAALEQVELARRAQREFLANMTHELRTPLNAIIGFAQILRDDGYGPVTAPQREALGDIESSGQRLLKVLSDVLETARLDGGPIELRWAEVPIPQIFDACYQLLHARADQAGLRFTTLVEPPAGRVLCDETKLKQVLLNLLHNAIKFTPAGGSVELVASSVPGGVRLAVRDTGIGIAPESLPLLLRPFEQVEGSLDRRYEGTGLGLFISRKLVEAHGGELRIDSALGRGTTVEVMLPDIRATLPTPGALFAA